MKKTLYVTLVIALSVSLLSCGGGGKKEESSKNDSTKTDSVKKEEAKPQPKECPAETKLEVGGKNLKPAPFEVKQAYVKKMSDNELTMYFENFASEKQDPNAKLKGKEVRVSVRISSNDKALEPGEYLYHAKEADYNKDGKVDASDRYPKYMISEVITKEGKTMLFWGMGDPNPGTLELYDITASKICGKIMVETKDDKSLGQQIIKGEFTVNF